MSAYNELIEKINEFVRKFYLNKVLQGAIYVAASMVSLYLMLFVWVYFFRPSVPVKTFCFFLFIALSATGFLFWVIRPGLSYFKLHKTLNFEQSAKLIGAHFFQVKDRLLNTLQLKALAESNPEHSAIIYAGIEQKIATLKPIPFTSAINLADNRRYLKYLLAPLLVILLIYVISPVILREGTDSFMRYNEEVLPKAPFEMLLTNGRLNVLQGDDLTLQVALKGDELPQDVYLVDGLNSFKLERRDISHFSYTMHNLQTNKTIRLNGGGFYSKNYEITVSPRPSLIGMSAKLIFPIYLHRKPEKMANAGDLLVPEGTKIQWDIDAENTDVIDFFIDKQMYHLTAQAGKATFNATVKNGGAYRLVPKNKYGTTTDSVAHQISVVTDQYPTISVTETPDSLSKKTFYFSGKVTDDYGFSSLKFVMQLIDNGMVVRTSSVPISIKNQQTENAFFYVWDLKNVSIKNGQILRYHLAIADNDGVNGPKTTVSEIKTYLAPSETQKAADIAKSSQELQQKMQSAVRLAGNIQNESKKISESLLDKKSLNFEDKKRIEDLLNKQKQLEEAVKNVKKANEENNFKKDENDFLDDDLKEKQKQIDDLFNNVLDQKTKDLLRNLQKLMDMNQKDMTQEELSKMQMDNKSLKNELNRILDLYKQLDFEQQLQNKIERLNDLAKQQQDLAKQTLDKNNPSQQLQQKQEQLQKDFDALKNELKNLEQQNQQLDKPNNFQNPAQQSKQISQKQQDSQKQLQQNNRKQASQEQKNAGDQMQQMANEMSEQQREGEEEDAKINAKELRQLLENLLHTSFEQEKLLLSLDKISTNDPSYVNIARQQSTIKNNMATIADSLYSLSKKAPQIESLVNKELDKVKDNMAKAVDNLAERNTSMARSNQQFAMTSINNLALMLNESLEQMQKKGKGGKGGKGKKKGMEQLQQMQDQLNKNMQQAKQQMQKDGNHGTVPRGQQSQQFARMAQQQQAIRQALEQLNKSDNKDGKGQLGNLNQMIQDMKKTESDLVNKRLTEETLKRQKDLTVKLLEAEKAQREQEQDNKREAKAAQQFPPQYQQMLDKFNKEFKKENESIEQVPVNFNYFYRKKVAEYFKSLNLPK